MMHRLVMSMTILGLAAALLAPSAGAQATVISAAVRPVTVYTVQRAKFEPPTWGFDRMVITIPPGTTVTWKSVPGNSDSHTSTSLDDGWSSPLLNPGDTWSFTFSKAGRYITAPCILGWSERSTSSPGRPCLRRRLRRRRNRKEHSS